MIGIVKRITHPWTLIVSALFLWMLVSNFYFLRLAVESGTDKIVDDPYKASLNYEAKLTSLRESAALGWKVEIIDPVLDFKIRLTGADGQVLKDSKIHYEFLFPADKRSDREGTLSYIESEKSFVIDSPLPFPGLWFLALTAEHQGKEFLSEKQVMIQR